MLWDISAVVNSELLVSIVNNRVFIDGTFEFKHHQLQTGVVSNAIGNSFVTAEDLQLIDYVEDILRTTFWLV